MEEKTVGLAMLVPVAWLGSILLFAIYTLASPVLFFVALFSTSSTGALLRDFINLVSGGVLH